MVVSDPPQTFILSNGTTFRLLGLGSVQGEYDTTATTTTTSTTTLPPPPTTTPPTTIAPTTTYTPTTTATPTTAPPTTTATPTTRPPTTTIAPGGPTCFLGHAPVATPSGPRRIDSLKEGDYVLTETGKAVKIMRIDTKRYRPGPKTNPYIIRKGQFGATEELLISPRHKVATPDGKMVEARDLGLVQKAMKSPFTYYNIELPGWANMRVAGVEVESLAPTKGIVVTMEQVKALAAALPKTADTTKTLNRICKKTNDGKMILFGYY